MADFDPDSKPRPRRDVIIQDLRHRRDVEEPEAEAPASEAAAADSAGAAVKQDVHEAEQAREQQAEEALEELPVAATGAEGATASVPRSGAPDFPAGQGGDSVPEGMEGAGYTEDEIRAMEREQLSQIIGLGLVNYLKYQLTMVLNFALLSLGSAPDPTTGLVTKDLPQAKLAIDVLEFLVARLQGEMSVAERQQMAQLVSDLKYSFMQAAADGAAPAGGAMPGGGLAGEA